MKHKFFLTFFIVFFVLASGTGEAFVPQTLHLLHLVIEKIKQPVGIEAFQTKKVINYEDSETGFFELDEKLIYLYPGRFRSQIVLNPTINFNVESELGFIKVTDGAVVSHNKSLVDLYTDILLYRDHDSLFNQLMLVGIDITKVSFQRYNDTICYVIGRPLEKGKPFAGLWIEKDTFFPFKYVVEKNGRMVEFFYGNWQRISKTWYPMRVSIFLDDRLFAMVDVKSFVLKTGFSPVLFDIEHIKQLYPDNDPDFFDENLQQVDKLYKSIENLNKSYE